jgi:hypothetical protein
MESGIRPGMTRFARMPDDELAAAVARLERTLAAMRQSTTACGKALAESYMQALTEARAEAERRLC